MIQINAAQPSAMALPRIAILFDTSAQAAAGVAGLPRLARLLRVLSDAGVREAWMIAGDGASLDPRVRAEASRLAPRVTLQTSAPADFAAQIGGSEILLLSGNHLIPGQSIVELLQGGPPMTWRGRTIARNVTADDLRAPPSQWLGTAAHGREPAGIVALAPAWTATRALLLATGKSTDGPVSRRLNRPVSRFLSALALQIPGIRPDHVTTLTAALAIAMFGCFLFGGETAVLVGAILFHVASVVDGTDGEIARVTFRGTPQGALFDTWVDRVTILLFFLGVTIGLARTEGTIHAVVGGWGFAAAIIGVVVLSQLLKRIGAPRDFAIVTRHMRQRFPGGWQRRVVEALAVLTSRDVFSFVFPMLFVLGLGESVTWLFTGFTTTWLVIVLYAVPMILKEAPAGRRRVEPAPASR
jgi:CDP-L-myo-inositol myo-inositolphosphotransferase